MHYNIVFLTKIVSQTYILNLANVGIPIIKKKRAYISYIDLPRLSQKEFNPSYKSGHICVQVRS